MMDWADEISLSLKMAATADDDIFKVSSDGLATALRKAKADGVREAAYLCLDADFSMTASRYDLEKPLLKYANEIEKGKS